MAFWLGVYSLGLSLSFRALTPSLWHAHELIFGYALAVIAGFLLTAVKNWTGVQTPGGWKLCSLFLFWAAARFAFFFGDAFIEAAAVMDLAFMAALTVSILVPILKAKLWRQLAILSKLVLLGAGNVLFYAGALGLLEQGARWGVYTGLYLVIGLILTMGRRVIPGFIERGVGYPVALVNRRWVDLSSMFLFLIFFILDTFTQFRLAAAWISAALFVLHSVRAAGWHTPGIWGKPLLWSLYCAYLYIILGFGLHALSLLTDSVSHSLAVHAFTVGGIGLITVSMMSRVSLGHTGRDINAPPKLLTWALVLVLLAAFVRVLIPIADTQHYLMWVSLSAALWISGFLTFAYIFIPILSRARVDGLPG